MPSRISADRSTLLKKPVPVGASRHGYMKGPKADDVMYEGAAGVIVGRWETRTELVPTVVKMLGATRRLDDVGLRDSDGRETEISRYLRRAGSGRRASMEIAHLVTAARGNRVRPAGKSSSPHSRIRRLHRRIGAAWSLVRHRPARYSGSKETPRAMAKCERRSTSTQFSETDLRAGRYEGRGLVLCSRRPDPGSQRAVPVRSSADRKRSPR